MAQIKRFHFRILIWIAGSLLGLLVLIALAIHTPPARRYALKQMVEILGNQGVNFDASGVEYNLFNLTATLRNVTIQSRRAPDLPPVAHADRVSVDLNLRKIISGKIYVEDGAVQNPVIHVVIDKDGRDNLPKSDKKKESESKTDWFIDKFRVDGGSVRFEDRRQKLDASLPLAQLTIDGKPFTDNHDILLTTTQPGSISLEQRSLPVRNVRADVQLQKNAIDVRSVKLALGDSNISLAGKLDNLDDPRYDFKADTDLALGSLVDFAGVKQRVDGTVHAALTATGPLNQLKATARLDGENLTIEKFDRLNLKAETTYDSVAQRVILESFNIFSPAGTIHGKANIALTQQAGSSQLNAAVRGLDLGKVSSTLALPVRVASSATGDIEARWPALKFDEATGDAIVRLAATRTTPARNVVPLSGTLNAKTSGNRMVIGIPSLRTLDAAAAGQVTIVNRRALSGNVKLTASNLRSTVAGAEAFLGKKRGTLVGTDVAGSATVEARLGGTVQNPSASLNLNSAGLQLGTLSGITLEATAHYNPSRLDIQSSRVEWQGQEVTASGVVGLKGRAPALKLEAHSSTLSIPALLAAAGKKDIPASGTLQFNTSISGTTKNPQVALNMSATDLNAYNEVFGTLNAQARVANQVVTLDQLHLDKPQEGGNGTLDAKATYDWNTKAYTADAKSNNLRLTSLTLPDGTPVRAKLQMEASGAGTVSNPGLKLKLAADQIQYASTDYGSANLVADVANQRADINAEVPKFNLSAKANIGTNEPYPSTFELVANKTDLATLPVKMERPVEGAVTATIRGTADLKTPEAGQFRIEVADANLKWNEQPVRTDGPLVATYQNRVLLIERATIVALDSKLSVDGRLPLDASAGAGAINIASTLNLASLVSYIPSDQPITAKGTATINGTITGTLKSIDPRLNISLAEGYFSTATMNPPLTNINLQAQVVNGALEVQKASLDVGPATLAASGQIPFALLPANLPVELPRRQGAAQFNAELRNLDLATIEGLPQNLAGTVSARLEAEAQRPDIEALNAKLTFPTLQISLGTYALQQQGTSTVSIRNGVATIDQFQLTGPETKIQIAGTAGLTGSRPLDVRVDGTADAAILSAFTDAVRARGATEVHVAVNGTAQQPAATGYVQLANAQLSLQNPRVGIDSLNARIDLAGNRVNLTRLTGNLNGGALSGGGGFTYANGQLRDTDLSVKADRVYLDYPSGLKTVSDMNIRLRSTADNLIVGGDVVIVDGGFTDNLNLDTGVLAALTAPRGVELTERRNPLVESILFDLGIRTANPLLIDNNLAKAEVDADLRLKGNPYQTGLAGRVSINEGGVFRLQERQYIVDRGEITFANERKIEPQLDILANTRAGDFDITMQIAGVPGKTETTLTSDPPLPEPDIMAVLLTGKRLDDLRGHEYEVARNQVLSYLTGRVGGTIGSGIARATGLSTVRIEPNLIANETDPSARLTVGQDITRNLELIYSMDLVNSSDQIYVAEYDLSKRFTTRGVRQQDGTFRFDFRHDVRFGGVPEPRRGDRRQKLIIDNVSILGNNYFSEKQLADKLGAKPGKRYDFFKTRKGVDKVEKLLRKENLLESAVRLNRQVEGDKVDLELQVTPGPAVEFVWEGLSPDGKLEKRVKEIWQSGVFDRQRAEDSVQEIQTALVKDDYLRPEIKYTITTPAPDRKRVLFDIATGPKFKHVDWEFEGAAGIEAEKLRDVIKGQKMSTEVYTKPGRVTELLQRYYAEEGYLEASLKDPRYELDRTTGTGRVVFPVSEGPLFRIARVEFNGNTVFDDSKLAATVPLPKGEAYRPVLRERSQQALQELYWEQGYNDVDAEISTKRDREAGTVDVIVKIAENRRSVVQEIVIEGNQKTSENMITTQLVLKTGDPLNLQKLSESRRNLYNTGAYSVVDIVREETEQRSRTTGPASNEKPVRLTVRVREVQPFQVRYGGSFDTERGPGAIMDIENRNSLGSARTLGLRTRYDRQLQEARLYFSQPLLRRFPVKTIASPFYRRERNPATRDSDPFNVDRVGMSVQQEARFRDFYILNYGYRIEQSKTLIVSDLPIPTAELRIASLTSTLTRETRDNVLDATRGDLMSHAIEFSPELLGSQVRFIKYFGQYFRYVPLEKPKVEIFTNKVQRPRFVYAGAVRLGLAKGFGGQEIPLAERFFAGGSTTIRGFEQNSVGPVLFDRTPLGGEAMLVINNEVRHPLFSVFDIAGFVDIGNVYRKVADISLGDLRKTAGLGLRVRTPWVLIRLDYGMKLDRRPGETPGRIFFSIGQAF